MSIERLADFRPVADLADQVFKLGVAINREKARTFRANLFGPTPQQIEQAIAHTRDRLEVFVALEQDPQVAAENIVRSVLALTK